MTFRELGLAVFAVLIVCLTVRVFIPSFIENDDVTIADFAMQGFAVRYLGIFLTSLMHLGYEHFPEIAWYWVILHACHFLSVYLWLSLLSRVFRPCWLAVLAALLFLGFYLVFVVYLDYASTSVMLCCVSLSWAYVDVLERRPGRLRPVLWGLAFVCGMLVRLQGAIGALAFLLPARLWVLLLALRDQPFAPECRRSR